MGGWDHIKGFISDRYQYSQGEKGNIMGEVANGDVGKGSGPLEKKKD